MSCTNINTIAEWQMEKLISAYDVVCSEKKPNDKGLLSIKTESFAGDELKILSLVKDRGLLDVTKLSERRYWHF